MAKIHFIYQKKENKRLPHQFNLDVEVDGELFRSYQSTNKADLSGPVYAFYKLIGMDVKPVFGDIDFPDCEARQKDIDFLTAALGDFRVFKKMS